METLSYEEYRLIWERMTVNERSVVREKARYEQVGAWAVLIQWPELIPKRLRKD